jgi:integrase
MPKRNVKQPDTKFRNAKPRTMAYKLYDEGGLRMLVRPTGAKVWQYPYKFNKRWNIHTIGLYPEIQPAEARRRRDEAKALLRQGIDPNDQKKAVRIQQEYMNRNSFEALALEWYHKQTWAEKHAKNIWSRLQLDVFPTIGSKAIAKVTRQEMLHILQNIENRGALDVAKRINQYCCAIFDYAILKGLCESNVSLGLTKFIKSRPVKHRLALPENKLAEFLPKLNNYHGTETVKLAMKFLMLSMLRPGEVVNTRWEEIDFDKAMMTVPANRMKMKRVHLVPLSTQALNVLARAKQIAGKSDLVFHGLKGIHAPLSNATLRKCLIILGYKELASAHGMRALASTTLNENKFRADAIEMQLAHVQGNKVRAAYNHAKYIDERIEMMQWWGDFIEGKEAGNAQKKNSKTKAA